MNHKKAIYYWTQAGRILPLTAIGLLFFTVFIGWDENIRTVLTILCTVFFCISIIWWWWVLDAVSKWMSTIESSTNTLNEVKDEISEVKKEVARVSNR